MYRTVAWPHGPSGLVVIIATILLVLVVGDPYSGYIDYPSGFECEDSPYQFFQLNGNRPFPRLVPTQVDCSFCCSLELTSDKAEPRAVSAFVPLEFSDDLFWFESEFTYKIAGSAAGSADGIAAVFHQDPRVQFARGGDGGNMGVYGSSNTIIRNALVVEIDTRK
jgi:hypothetical protein